MKNRWAKRRQLQALLVVETGCGGTAPGDWPCGTCFRAMTLPGVSVENLDVMWDAVLVLRGGYKSEDLSETQVTQVIDRLIEKLTEAQQVH